MEERGAACAGEIGFIASLVYILIDSYPWLMYTMIVSRHDKTSRSWNGKRFQLESGKQGKRRKRKTSSQHTERSMSRWSSKGRARANIGTRAAPDDSATSKESRILETSLVKYLAWRLQACQHRTSIAPEAASKWSPPEAHVLLLVEPLLAPSWGPLGAHWVAS